MLLTVLLVLCGLALVISAAFTYESIREQQLRAPKVGMALLAVCSLLLLVVALWPEARGPLAVVFAVSCGVLALLAVPGPSNKRALRGARGYLLGSFEGADERDIVFARNRALRPNSEEYRSYYAQHPEREERDARRRAMGAALGEIGRIDKSRQLSAMVPAVGQIQVLLAPHAVKAPASGAVSAELDPARATEIVKGFATHLGAVAVGVCKVDPRWAYSHRGEIHLGNWEDWGKEIESDLPYAVVFLTEMDHEMVGTSPHTPTTVESATNYAQGAVISTVLAQWFAGMGYRGEAEHQRRYKHNLVPLALDAGLGELGRFGYLVSDVVGGRGRLAACLTDMPLVPDEPVDLGVEAFCERCKKCADSCPSRSLPQGEKAVDNGRLLWKMDAESCFDYWGKVGTDCSVCMIVCPFSRPNRSVHKLVRWFLRRSSLAQRVFPYVDNVLYGKRWKPRRGYVWADYPWRKGAAETPAAEEGSTGGG